MPTVREMSACKKLFNKINPLSGIYFAIVGYVVDNKAAAIEAYQVS